MKIKVLIVEDAPLLSDLVAHALFECGFKDVVIVGTIKEARDAFDNALKVGEKFDVIFFDGRLPDGLTTDGLIQDVVTVFPDTATVAMSGESRFLQLLQMRQGFSYVLMKPFRLDQVKRVIQVIQNRHLTSTRLLDAVS